MRVGKLLIANPILPRTSPWSKRVIYIFADDEIQGTRGLIVNHPTRYSITEFVAGRGWDMPLSREFIRVGGPVNSKVLFMLHTNEWHSSSTAQVGNSLAISCDEFMLEKMGFGDQPNLWRMALGMCSWAPGQLDMEINGDPPYNRSNSWLVADADTNILFEYDSEKQWKEALELSSKQTIDSWF